MDDQSTIASGASRVSAKAKVPASGVGSGLGSDVVRANKPEKYHQSKQIQILHGLSVLLDISVFIVLLSLVFSGVFRLQTQVDGYFIVGMISLFHLLLNVPLVIAIYRQWDGGFALFMSTAIPCVIATVAVEIYLLVDEVRVCKTTTELDEAHTTCFGPPILLFALLVVNGLLSHLFSRRWRFVNTKQAHKGTRNASTSNIESKTAGGGTTLLQSGTVSPGIVVGESQRSIQTKGQSNVSGTRPKPVLGKVPSSSKVKAVSPQSKSRSQKHPNKG